MQEVGDYSPAAWVAWLRRWGLGVASGMVAAGVLALSMTGRAAVPLLALVATMIAVAMMRLLPRRLPPIEHLGGRHLRVVEREAASIFAYALVHPLLLIGPIVLALAVPASLLPGHTTSGHLALVWVLVGKLALLGVPAALFAGRFGRADHQLGLRSIRGRWRWAGPVVPLALVCGVLASITSTHLAGIPAAYLGALAGIALLHAGFPEEAFYRVLLQSRLELLLGSRSAIAVTALLFGLRHVPALYAFTWSGTTGHALGDAALSVGNALAYQAVFGVLFGYMWARYRNAWMNIAGHTAFDFFAFLGLLS